MKAILGERKADKIAKFRGIRKSRRQLAIRARRSTGPGYRGRGCRDEPGRGRLGDNPAAVIFDPWQRKRHEQERLAAAAGQPLARIARLYWDDHGDCLRDPGAFAQMLRPACRRCTARRGIIGPVACRLPPHQTLCRRHRLWTGPAARTHSAQLDISQPPRRVLTVSRSPLIAVAAAGLLLPEGFSRRRPQPGYRSGYDQG